jgi:hypothetical protein
MLVDWYRASTSLSVQSSVVLNELQEQLLARERLLGSREGTIVMWEESLVAFTRALTEARVGHDAIHTHTDAIRHHYLADVSTSNSQSDRRIAIHRSLDEKPSGQFCGLIVMSH